MARTKLRTPPNRYPTQTLKVGDEVVWSKAFLLDTGDVFDRRWAMKGRIVDLLGHVAHVLWIGDDVPWMVATCNLAKPLSPKAAD